MTKKIFDKLRKEKDYRTLGQKFWNEFAILPRGKRRDCNSELWRSLSKREQKLCEEI